VTTLPPHMRPTFTAEQAIVLALRLLYTDATQGTLGAEYGVSGSTINRAASRWATSEELRAAAIAKMVAARARPGYTRRPPTPRFDFAAIDWAWTDTAIARQLGCTCQAARCARARLGKAASPNLHRQERTLRIFGVRGFARDRREAEIARRLIETDATCHTIGAELGVSTATVHGILRKHTTPEQRKALRARKIAKNKRETPGGFTLVNAKLAARAQSTGDRVARIRECQSCGASVRSRTARCPKCGSSSLVLYGQTVPAVAVPRAVTPADSKARARQNLRRFLSGLEVA
jgi:Trp operon repressor